MIFAILTDLSGLQSFSRTQIVAVQKCVVILAKTVSINENFSNLSCFSPEKLFDDC